VSAHPTSWAGWTIGMGTRRVPKLDELQELRCALWRYRPEPADLPPLPPPLD
jgi:hypothetical protein